MQAKPESEWYNGRAIAESVRSLAWKYSVKAKPFDIEDVEADKLLLARMAEILKEMPRIPNPAGSLPAISPRMRELRADNFESRRDSFLAGRIDDQVSWYSVKAAFNADRTTQWNIGLIALEGIAVILAILRSAGAFDFDWVGIAGTLAASGIAWMQTKQHETLQRAYAVTSHELALVADECRQAAKEDDWAEIAEQAEEAISREHTLWLASRR